MAPPGYFNKSLFKLSIIHYPLPLHHLVHGRPFCGLDSFPFPNFRTRDSSRISVSFFNLSIPVLVCC